LLPLGFFQIHNFYFYSFSYAVCRLDFVPGQVWLHIIQWRRNRNFSKEGFV